MGRVGGQGTGVEGRLVWCAAVRFRQYRGVETTVLKRRPHNRLHALAVLLSNVVIEIRVLV